MQAVLLTPIVPNDIMLELTVRKGKNQLRTVLGYYKETYVSRTSTASNSLALAPAEVYWGVGTNCLTVSTDRPVMATISKEDGTSYKVRINKLFVLDENIAGFNIANDGQGVAELNVCYSYGTVDVSTRGVLSVNDNFPDANGNVEVDTGVMTVNGQAPVDGNVDLVEEAPDDGNDYTRNSRSWKDLRESTDEGSY